MEHDVLALDRMMPFDFITHRRAKHFFKEDLVDIDTLLVDKDKAEQMMHATSEYEEEHEKLREVPELNERLKQIFKVIPKSRKPKKKKIEKHIIKGELSSTSSEDQMYEDYNYA